jgi:hypothetical protein
VEAQGVSAPLGQAVVLWTPGPVRCGDALATPRRLEAPQPGVSWVAPQDRRPPSGPVTLRFRIDATGRPLGIAREPSDPDGSAIYVDSGDLEPALAVSTFSGGEAQEACRISYAPQLVPLAQASEAQLIEALAGPLRQSIMPTVRRRLSPPGATCMDVQPRPRVIYYPPFDEIRGERGHIGQLAYRNDIDATGKTTNIQMIYSSAPAAANAAAVQAIARSRFAPRAATGCITFATHTEMQSLDMPEPADSDQYRDKDAQCPSPLGPLLELGTVPFPEAFRRRSVLGWAIVRFDIAPWGAIGNVKALAAEPADGFGKQAEQVVRAAHAQTSATGYSGCVMRVLFRLDPNRPEGNYLNQ